MADSTRLLNPKKELIIAALLHDIGKFYKFKTGSDHTLNGESYIDDLIKSLGGKRKIILDGEEVDLDQIKKMIREHHEPERYSLTELIKESDNLSAEERGEGSYKEKSEKTSAEEVVERIRSLLKAPIVSIRNELDKYDEVFIRGKRLSQIIEEIKNSKSQISNLLLTKKSEESEIYNEKAWKEFLELSSKVFQAKKSSVFYNNINLILMDFTRFIPSSVKKEDEEGLLIPLYDHLKLTAALVPIVYYYKNNKTAGVTFISIDIGNIQKFINKSFDYEVGRKGATKRIRGRSLFVTILSKIISLHILEKLNLAPFNEIICTAGRILIISYKLDEEKKKEIREELESLFLKEENKILGDLTISIVFKDYQYSELEKILKDFNQVIEDLEEEYEKEKARRFRTQINKFKELNEKLKESEQKSFEICKVCGNLIETKEKCSLCKFLEILGSKVVKEHFIVISKEKEKDFDFKIKIGDKEYSILLLEEKDIKNSNKEKEYFIFVFFSNIKKILEEFKNNLSLYSFIPILEIPYSPLVKVKKDNEIDTEIAPLEREEIEEEGKEIIEGKPLLEEEIETETKEKNVEEKIKKEIAVFNYLSLIYFDVDNLGKIFSGKKFYNSILDKCLRFESIKISKWSFLSFYINFFFSVIGYYLADKYKIYVIFSGGDDIRAFGNPYAIFNFTIEFINEFLTYFDKRITLSGSFVIAHKYQPIIDINDSANELEKAAKKKEKGRIVFINKKYEIPLTKIEKLKEVYNKIKEVENPDSEKISIHSLYNIFKLLRNHIALVENVESGKLYLSFAKVEYILKRNWKGEDYEEFFNYIISDKNYMLFIVSFMIYYLVKKST
ncbi:MAG: type III-A CRISPR-associated protein Cas10/Csm1 [Candidatus Aenigmatarchaeota archaeon]